MKISNRLKKIVFNKLYEDLSHVEIIPYKDFIYFIDRENKYWYFEYNKNGTLYWRYQFFMNFFELFSLKPSNFGPILSEWVEEVLNCKVVTTKIKGKYTTSVVEEVLNCKVVTTPLPKYIRLPPVEEVLNCKVVTTVMGLQKHHEKVEEVLNCKVVTSYPSYVQDILGAEEVLDCKVVTTSTRDWGSRYPVEEVLDNTI